jgi:hypothetical protein
MTLPILGPLSLANIQTEFGGTAPISSIAPESTMLEI